MTHALPGDRTSPRVGDAPHTQRREQVGVALAEVSRVLGTLFADPDGARRVQEDGVGGGQDRGRDRGLALDAAWDERGLSPGGEVDEKGAAILDEDDGARGGLGAGVGGGVRGEEGKGVAVAGRHVAQPGEVLSGADTARDWQCRDERQAVRRVDRAAAARENVLRGAADVPERRYRGTGGALGGGTDEAALSQSASATPGREGPQGDVARLVACGDGVPAGADPAGGGEWGGGLCGVCGRCDPLRPAPEGEGGGSGDEDRAAGGTRRCGEDGALGGAFERRDPARVGGETEPRAGTPASTVSRETATGPQLA